jgi:hypothetical protein
MPAADEILAESDEGIGLARLAVKVPAAVSRHRAASVLGEERDAWLGEAVDADPGVELEPGMRRHQLDLELRVTEHAPRVAFRKAAFVDVGPLLGGGKGPLSLSISWRAAGLQPLFPVFAGTLRWAEGQLELTGVYAPPGGGIGMVADRLLLNVAARGTARWLLARIAALMRGEAVPAD